MGSTATSTSGPSPVADLFAVVEHRCFVFFTFADDDDTAHRHGGQELTHRVNRGSVATVLVALADPTSGRECGGLCHAHEFHRQVTVRSLEVGVSG